MFQKARAQSALPLKGSGGDPRSLGLAWAMLGTAGTGALVWGAVHNGGTAVVVLLEDWPCEDGLGGTGGVVGLFGTEAAGTKVQGLGGGAGCFPLDTGGVGT